MDPRDRFVLEAPVQRGNIEVLELLHWRTWRIGQRDARGTQDPGPADLISLKPGCGVLFTESKRIVGGRQSPAQKEFEAHCIAAGVPYILANDPAKLFATLVEMKGARNG
jgi:hypothetical protein